MINDREAKQAAEKVFKDCTKCQGTTLVMP